MKASLIVNADFLEWIWSLEQFWATALPGAGFFKDRYNLGNWHQFKELERKSIEPIALNVEEGHVGIFSAYARCRYQTILIV